MTNGIGIINGFDVNASSPIDKRYGLYTGSTLNECLTNVTTTIPQLFRHEGLTVGVKVGSNNVVNYWFAGGVLDSDLKLKSQDLSGYSQTGHTHYQLFQPNGTNPFVYTDNGGNLHIDGNIYQSGDTYETHAQNIYTSGDTITLRENAVAGLSTGELAGLTIKNYDGTNDGSLKIDKDGWLRVGDAGNEQKIATIEETTVNDSIMKYNTSTNRLEGISPNTYSLSGHTHNQYLTGYTETNPGVYTSGQTDTQIDTKRKLLSCGPITNVTVSGNTSGIVNIGSIQANFNSNADFTGNINTFTIPALNGLQLVANQYTYITAQYNNGVPQYVTTTDNNIINHSTILNVVQLYWENINSINEIHIFYTGTYGLGLANKIGHRLLHTERFGYESGLILGEYGTRNISISAGRLWYDGEEIDTLSVSGATAGHESHFYYPVGGVLTATKVSQYPNTQYSNGTNLANLTGNKYTTIFVWKCVNSTDRCNYIMLGGEYNSIADASGAKLPLVMPDVIVKQGKFIGRIVIQNNQNTASQITNELTSNIGQTPVTNHNSLSNLQGGTTNEYYHLTNNQVSKIDALESTYLALTGGTLTGKLGSTISNSFLTGTTNFRQYEGILTRYTGNTSTVTEGIYENITYSGTTNVSGVYGLNLFTINSNTATVSNLYGLQSYARNDGAGKTTSIVGGYFSARNGTTGAFNKMLGMQSLLTNNSADVTNNDMYGMSTTMTIGPTGFTDSMAGITAYMTNNGTINEATGLGVYFTKIGNVNNVIYGIKIGSSEHPWVGSSPNMYGLYIHSTVSGGTVNNYGIYSDTTSKNYLKGELGVKMLPTNDALSVSGDTFIYGSVSGTTFYGSGAGLTNIPISGITNIQVTLDGKSNTGHTHYQLHQPDGINPFVYTDNGGNLHIDGNIYQSGSTYETHAEQVYTTKDDIILRDGASAGLSTGELAGLTIKKYDGTNDGSLKIDKDGWMRVGDAGQEQKIATIEETTLDNYLMKYNASTFRLEGVNPTSLPVSTASDLKYVYQDGGTIWHNKSRRFQPTGTFSSSGITVTTTGGQLTSAMIGAKIGVGNDRRIIVSVPTTNTCTVNSVFSQNYSGVTSANWGVWSIYLLDNGSDTYGIQDVYGWNGNLSYRIDGSTLSIDNLRGSSNNVNYNTNYAKFGANRPIVWTNDVSGVNEVGGTTDLGLYRPSAGRLKIYDGVTSSNRRDLELRNLYTDNVLTTSGGTKYLNEDGGITWYTTKRFTPTSGSTASSSGTTVTLSGSTQFTSAMVGNKFGFGLDKRIITSYISNTQVTVDSAFNQNYSGISDWGVYSVTFRYVPNGWYFVNSNGNDGFGVIYSFLQNINLAFGNSNISNGGYIRMTPSNYIGFTKPVDNNGNFQSALVGLNNGTLGITKGDFSQGSTPYQTDLGELILGKTKIGKVYQTALNGETNNTAVTSINVLSTNGFPTTGTILIGGVTSVVYTGKTSTSFTFASTVIPTYTKGSEVLVTSAGSYTEVTSDGSLKVKNTTSGATVFNVQGTTGQLFQINDVQTGTLFSVSDISGINLLSVDSSGYLLQNSGQQIGMGTGTTTVYQLDKTKGSACFIDYRVSNATTGAFRAGTISGVWDNVNNRIEFTETSTNDLYASTSGIVLSMTISGNYVNLISTISTGTWNIKLGVRII